MSFIVTPRRLTRLSDFYYQLGTMMAAGLGLVSALQEQKRSPADRSFVAPVSQLIDSLAQGYTFTDSLRGLRGWAPSFDMALLAAGEQSGRLDICCKLLAEYYREHATLVRQAISDLLYPCFILHAAVFINPTLSFLFLGSSLTSFLLSTLGILVPIYAVVIGLIVACQGRHGERWRAVVERVLAHVPLIGVARRNLALTRLAAALEALLGAGVSIIDGWRLAATASGSPSLREAVLAWKPGLERGSTPADLLRETPAFPSLFANLYQTGEISGTLEDTLRRLRILYQEESSRQLKAIAAWVPRLIYMVLMAVVGLKIIGMWTNYMGVLKDVIG